MEASKRPKQEAFGTLAIPLAEWMYPPRPVLDEPAFRRKVPPHIAACLTVNDRECLALVKPLRFCELPHDVHRQTARAAYRRRDICDVTDRGRASPAVRHADHKHRLCSAASRRQNLAIVGTNEDPSPVAYDSVEKRPQTIQRCDDRPVDSEIARLKSRHGPSVTNIPCLVRDRAVLPPVPTSRLDKRRLAGVFESRMRLFSVPPAWVLSNLDAPVAGR